MSLNRKLVIGAVAGLAVAGGGAALAATQIGSPKEENQAIINDAAQRLGIQPSALSNALKESLKARVDAAVAAGNLTKDEGDAIKARIDSGDAPLFFTGPPRGQFGGPPMGHFEVGFRGLDTAASYLGLSVSDLRSKLESGKSLADVAKDQGKSVDGLIQALVDDAKKHLDDAVSQGRLTQDQEQSILANVKQHITDFVNGDFPGGFGPGGPPGMWRGTPPGMSGDTMPDWGPSA
ncbi:MAG TPA: hypothetical protein VF895_08960 [Gaiellaceae bacterium]